MKFIHLSDLHLGKRVNEVSMIEDQKYILDQIIEIIKREEPDGVLIAGDVYDKSMPSAEAVELFDDFLYKLTNCDTEVFVISGNHDSAERIAYGGRLLHKSGVHMSPVYRGDAKPVVLRDESGPVNVYLLPFIKPSTVRGIFPDKEIRDYTEAVACAIDAMDVQPAERNVLVCHQFVTGAERCDSEEISVGGLDNVSVDVFKDFDYVALGHIHSPQEIGSHTIRYCGTPLKYSFSEAKDHKSVTVVEMGPKGEVAVRTLPLTPLHDMRELRMTYAELMERSFINSQKADDYLHIILTDEEEITNAFHLVRSQYKNIMKFSYDNIRSKAAGWQGEDSRPEEKTPLELFSAFYELQNGQPMNEEQNHFVSDLIDKIWEGKA